MSHISLHQEIVELKNQILRARNTLQELMQQYHHMNEFEKNALHAEYDKHFKQLEIDIQRKALQNSELQRRAELLMTKYQRGEKLTPELIALIHKVVDKEYDALKSRMHELLRETTKAHLSNIPNHIHASLPKLYKELAKKLHPDSGANPDLTKKYWTSVQKAYDDKDLHTMHALHTLICSTSLPDSIELNDSNIDELQRELSQLIILIEKEQEKLKALKSQIPFCYALGLQDESWIAKHEATLKQQVEKYTSEIRKSQDIIRMLTGSEWTIDQDTLEKTDSSIKEKREYTEEFIDATYFSGRH